MTVGMEEDQIFTLIILLDTIPVREGEGFLALDELSTDRTASCLLPQECCTKRRGPLVSFRRVRLIFHFESVT